jgi:membrane protein
MPREVNASALIRAADWLLAREPHLTTRPARALHRLIKLLIIVARQFVEDHCFSRAAALAFSTALTIIPLSALSLFLLKLLFVNRFNQLENFIIETLLADANQDAAREFLSKIATHIDLIGRGGTGLLVLGVLIFTSLSLYAETETVCNGIWEVERGRNYGQRLANFLAFLTLGIIAVAVLYSLLIALTRAGGGLSIAATLLRASRSLILFFILFKFLPNTRVHIRPALLSALVTAVLWDVMRAGINVYILRMFSASPVAKVYGSLALLPITLFFIYLTWLLVLIGVELNFALQNLDLLFARNFIVRRHEQDCLLRLSILAEISRRFLAGEAAPSSHALAREFHLPSAKGEEIADDLKALELVVVSEAGTLHPASDPRHTEAAHVFRLLIKSALGKHIGVAGDEAATLYPRLLRAFEREFGTETLADLSPASPKATQQP